MQTQSSYSTKSSAAAYQNCVVTLQMGPIPYSTISRLFIFQDGGQHLDWDNDANDPYHAALSTICEGVYFLKTINMADISACKQ